MVKGHRSHASPERVEAVIRWLQGDPFWSNNILSPAALRKHFDCLELEMHRGLWDLALDKAEGGR